MRLEVAVLRLRQQTWKERLSNDGQWFVNLSPSAAFSEVSLVSSHRHKLAVGGW